MLRHGQWTKFPRLILQTKAQCLVWPTSPPTPMSETKMALTGKRSGSHSTKLPTLDGKPTVYADISGLMMITQPSSSASRGRPPPSSMEMVQQPMTKLTITCSSVVVAHSRDSGLGIRSAIARRVHTPVTTRALASLYEKRAGTTPPPVNFTPT